METQLETTFHSMSNHTNPQFINEGRPTASLGSFNFRTPVTRPQLLQFDPPRFSGGCGGIDLYGGSFSYISKEELQGLMRQIAANAKSYAFNLALGAVCNKCLQVMEGLQDKVQKINQMMKSSCDMAQAVVNSAADPLVAQMSGSFQQGAQAARQGGTVSDLWASMNQGWGKESSEAALALSDRMSLHGLSPATSFGGC
ncbi:MAG: conjugal transfer protein TraH [Ahniella sp.]|nr:conjugal transfer protein TraH [Ahniella sp.]